MYVDKLVTVITGNGKDIRPKLNNNQIDLGFLIKLFWLFKL